MRRGRVEERPGGAPDDDGDDPGDQPRGDDVAAAEDPRHHHDPEDAGDDADHDSSRHDDREAPDDPAPHSHPETLRTHLAGDLGSLAAIRLDFDKCVLAGASLGQSRRGYVGCEDVGIAVDAQWPGRIVFDRVEPGTGRQPRDPWPQVAKDGSGAVLVADGGAHAVDLPTLAFARVGTDT